MRERAEAIGATYSLYSEPGEGTQISVTWEETGKLSHASRAKADVGRADADIASMVSGRSA